MCLSTTVHLSHSFHSVHDKYCRLSVITSLGLLLLNSQLPWQLQLCYIGALCIEILLLQLSTICF